MGNQSVYIERVRLFLVKSCKESGPRKSRVLFFVLKETRDLRLAHHPTLNCVVVPKFVSVQLDPSLA